MWHMLECTSDLLPHMSSIRSGLMVALFLSRNMVT